MGPGGIGTTRGLPTDGLKSLLSYYGGEGPSREKLATFIRTYLVYDGAAVPDDLIDLRYQASLDPEVVASPPLQRPSGLRTLWRMDLTRDKRLRHLPNPTLVLWGRDDKVNRPTGGPLLLKTMPNAELVMTSHTGHWMQWERAELFNQLVADFLSPTRDWRLRDRRVRRGPPRLPGDRNREVRRLAPVRPRRHRHAPRRDAARDGAVPPRRQRVPIPAPARTGRGHHRAGLAGRRPRHLRGHREARPQPRRAGHRGHGRRDGAARRRPAHPIPGAERADPGGVCRGPNRRRRPSGLAPRAAS